MPHESWMRGVLPSPFKALKEEAQTNYKIFRQRSDCWPFGHRGGNKRRDWHESIKIYMQEQNMTQTPFGLIWMKRNLTVAIKCIIKACQKGYGK